MLTANSFELLWGNVILKSVMLFQMCLMIWWATFLLLTTPLWWTTVIILHKCPYLWSLYMKDIALRRRWLCLPAWSLLSRWMWCLDFDWTIQIDDRQTTLLLCLGTLKASYPANSAIQPNVGMIVLLGLMVFRCHLLRQLIPARFIAVEGNYWLWSCR